MRRFALTSDSARRRMRYALFRFGCVGWRTAVELKVLHFSVMMPATGILAILLDLLACPFRLAQLAVYIPIASVCGWATKRVFRRYRQVWPRFPALRREMRERRLARLRNGGWALRRFERLTAVHVGIPVGVVFAAAVFVCGSSPPGHVRYVVLFFGIITFGVVLACALLCWNDRYRPRNLHALCPRCGYDLSASPDRCPECGMRRLAPVRASVDPHFSGI